MKHGTGARKHGNVQNIGHHGTTIYIYAHTFVCVKSNKIKYGHHYKLSKLKIKIYI